MFTISSEAIEVFNNCSIITLNFSSGKSDNEYKKIPVYFLTAISGSEVENHLEETKADGYILKPFNFSDFEVIFDILNGRA